jgi:di/tricarboxylate transporter
MLSLALPWPRPDAKWSAILSPQEAFSGFGSVAVIMVTAMFVFSAAMVRTGAAEMIGGRLFRVCAHNELLLQIAVLFVAAAFSMFINETTIVLVFMPVVLGGVQRAQPLAFALPALRRLRRGARGSMDVDRHPQQHHRERFTPPTNGSWN